MVNKVMLIVRDGRGYSESEYGNAIMAANTPNDDNYTSNYPTCLVKCTGNDVWNPDGVQGWSEVGHLTIWAGRVVWQPYELVNQEIKNWWFFKNPALLGAIENCKKNNSDLHLAGLFSDQWIHADFNHIFSLLTLCKQNDFDRVFIHIIADGRDVPEKSVLKFLDQAEKKSQEIGIWKIVSVIWRYYSMDRDNNRDRTKAWYDLMVNGTWFKAKSARDAINDAYTRWDKSDYYIQPTVIIDENEKPLWCIKDNDSVIWFNIRTDRSIQMTAMLNWLPECPSLPANTPKIYYACFTEYNDGWTLPVAFPQLTVKNNLGAVLANNWLKQLRIAETEKFAHVTFFFNSQINEANPWEDRVVLPSPKVPSYDEKPEMSAYEITSTLLEKIWAYDFILVNYANPDLVWHSWNFQAVVKACEVVDECVWKVVNKWLEAWYTMLIMADHGNAEHMLLENWEPDTSHWFDPIRFSVVWDKNIKLKDGWMKDIAPTALQIMWIEKPVDMTGESLIVG